MARELNHIYEIPAAKRLDHVHYAIHDIVVLADELAREGKRILPLNVGDPLQYEALGKAVPGGVFGGWATLRRAAEAGLITMPVCVPIMEDLAESVAARDCVPAVWKAALKLCTPASPAVKV